MGPEPLRRDSCSHAPLKGTETPSSVRLVAALLCASLSCNEGAPVPPHDFAGDTTSHAFLWQREFIGGGNGDVFYDAAIVNDSLAFAVGAFSAPDSIGGTGRFNVARWNGSAWSYSATPDTPFSPLWSVFPFAHDDVWAGSTRPEHWDGHAWSAYGGGYTGIFPIRKMWGTSSRDLYAVGDKGHIEHFDGVAWHDLVTGTTLDFRDIYGARDIQTGGWQILAVAAASPPAFARKIVVIDGETVTPLPDYNIQFSLQGIWFIPHRYYAAVGGGVYVKFVIEEPVWRNGSQDVTQYRMNGVRGVDVDDLFIAGDAGEVLHYNGRTWYNDIVQTGFAGSYNAVTYKGDFVLAVGTNSVRAVVARGRRVH